MKEIELSFKDHFDYHLKKGELLKEQLVRSDGVIDDIWLGVIHRHPDLVSLKRFLNAWNGKGAYSSLSQENLLRLRSWCKTYVLIIPQKFNRDMELMKAALSDIQTALVEPEAPAAQSKPKPPELTSALLALIRCEIETDLDGQTKAIPSHSDFFIRYTRDQKTIANMARKRLAWISTENLLPK
jgi:hypothetical protein